MNSFGVHTHTPTLAVIDPRGAVVRSIAYCRAEAEQPAQPHITRQVFDPRGREVERYDPRLWAGKRGPNRTSLHTLSGTELLRISVDAGWTLALPGQAGQALERWDSRSIQRRSFDEQLRPIAITEQLGEELPRVVERFEYGGPDGSARNQCGQLIRHDDPSTTRHMPEYDLRGLPLLESSHFVKSLEPVNWPLEIEARDALLETAPGLHSRWTYDALGEISTQTDARLNRRRFSRTCAGQLSAAYLQRRGDDELTLVSEFHYNAAGQVEQERAGNGVIPDEVTLVSELHYNAAGQVEQERAGNGVITRGEYRPEDSRLVHLSAGLPGQPLLQDLRYTYDPVGNPLQIDDRSKATTFFKNQRIDPVSTYTYDSRYRLISASGREVYRAGNDPGALVNYREEYDYDPGDNLLELRHLGEQPFTRRWVVATDSNRSLIVPDGDPPPDFSIEFDGNGNQMHLSRGHLLQWDTRNQLHQVSPVQREDGPDDTELYRYGGGGKRLRKVRCALTAGRTVLSEVRYLPGLEIHRAANGDERHVLEAEAGRNTVQLRHWVGNPPTVVDNDHLSYSLNDHLGSSLLELDEQGAVLSDEGYLPFGGRAWWVAQHGAKASFKTRGYSGKERDATGLYYYGYRYYAPWQQRWLNPDPAGEVDGLNVYGFVGNSPLRYVDRDGRIMTDDDQALLTFAQSVAESAAQGDRDSLALFSTGNEFDEFMNGFFQNLESDSGEDPSMQAFLQSLTHPAENPVQVGSVVDELVRYDAEMSRRAEQLAIVGPASPRPGESAQSPGVAPASPMPGPNQAGLSLSEAEPQSETTAADMGGAGQVDAVLKRHFCGRCGKNFEREGQLTRHLRTHTGEYKCETCGRCFGTKDNLKQHIPTHTRAKPYKCAACGRDFSRPGQLKIHSRIHTGEKSYTCETCGQGFRDRSDLTKHRRIHTGEKPYTCETCGRSFVQSSNLHTHIRWRHRGP
ncbi:C2H2-type zinc finger protein [Pseudomonas silesiensis]|uniref:C2H2-type zinc finger protein n=1 Tax=Pseudomonas silesiensis TaxID=1853130 RepID=UPI0030D8E545